VGHRRDILCTVIVLTILVFGTVFEENILPSVGAQSTTLEIKAVAIDGNDTFNYTVNGPTSYNPNISTTESGIFTGEVAVYHTFDTTEIDQSSTLQNLYVNSGTFGHNADAHGLSNRFHSSIGSDDGIIGDSIFVENSQNQDIILGNWINLDQWNFLVDEKTQKYSINFWIRGDFNSLGVGDGAPILSAMSMQSPQDATEFGFDLWVNEFRQPSVRIWNNGNPIISFQGSNLQDNNWQMVTLIIDKKQGINTATIWVNATNPVSTNSSSTFQPMTGSYIDQPLLIGDSNAPSNRIDYNATTVDFSIDDLCIIKDYEFTQADVEALYFDGEGSRCADITGLGTSTTDIPVLSYFDELNGINSINLPQQISSDFVIGNIIDIPTDATVTKLKLYFEGSDVTSGTLQAVILSNITQGVSMVGDEIIEAVSDSIDFSDPQFQASNFFVTFNFTGTDVDFSNGDVLVGIKGTSIGGGSALALNAFNGNVGSGGESLCIDLTNSTSSYSNCNDNYTPQNFFARNLMYEANIEGNGTTNGAGISNREIEGVNFANNGSFGTDNPNPVDPGTYSIQETIPAGWNLTDASCNDVSSSFSVDTISDISINSGDNIECTFENEFVGSSDADGDGIFDGVDTLPNTVSDDFSDIALGGTSLGTITTRGNQTLTITDEPNPDGVRIAADVSGGLLPAVVNVCGEISIIPLSSGDEVVVTCGSVTIDVINGPVDVAFISSGGTQATTSLSAGNSITFDQDTFSFSAPSTNTQTIIIDFQGTSIILEPDSTISFGLLKITKLTTSGDDTFDFTVTGPTSYNPNINTDSGGDPPTGEIVILNEIQHMETNNALNLDFTEEFGVDSLVGQEVTFSGQVPTKIRINNMRLSDFTNNDATLQFRIYSNYTLGVTEFQDLVLEASSDILFANATDYEAGGNSVSPQFNFTSAPSLTGTFAVSLVATNPNWFQGAETQEFEVYEDGSLIPGDCFSIEDITNPSSVITRASNGEGNIDCEDFPFKVFVQTTTNPRILWDDYRENYGHGIEFDVIFGTTGAGDHYIVGNRVNLTASSILNITIPALQCVASTDGTLVAKIWDRPTVGSTIIPTVHATSDTWGVIANANSDCSTGGLGPNNVFDITFNFTAAPELTGEYFIGIETDDFNDFTIFDIFYGNSIAYPLVPYDPIVFMGYNATDGWVEEILTKNDDEILDLRMSVIQNQGGASGGGMGIDGPSLVDPGTYSIQETIPAGWTLTSATCNDGSSSFSVDSVSGIVIDSGDNIECTFENEFGASSDTDGDGIFDDVDTLPNTVSDDFSDIALGGTSLGTITTRGNQTLTITEEPNPDGVRITADISGGLLPAVVSACGGISIITLSPGDNIIVTCGSVTINVINGPVDIIFMGSGGTQATTSLTTGNSLTFDQDTFSFSVPSTNVDPVVVIVEGEQIILSPGQAVSVLLSNKDSFIKQGELNTNEGANTMMRVRDNGNNRALVSFDQNEILAATQERTLSSATLRLYIEENGNNWGLNGRTINVHRLLADWTEGNGFNDKPESMSLSQFNDLKTRGDGLGVTWNCATDTEINNQQTNCSPQWNGASFNLTPTDTITIFKDNPPTGTVKTIGWIEFDVTSDLQTFLSNTEQNYGWIVKKTEEGDAGLVEFTSDESATNMPELVLVFAEQS